MLPALVLVFCVSLYGVAGFPERQLGCPIPPPFDIDFCSRALPPFECKDSSDCRKDDGKSYKCCATFCNGRVCVEQKYKPGACPPQEKKVCVDQDEIRCGVDSECPGDQLCCGTACGGSACKDPARPPYVKFGCPFPPRGIFFCPAVLPIFECKSDDDCEQPEVCCQTACGSVLCLDPQTKPGNCPRLPLTQVLCKRFDAYKCGVDRECDGDKKCCKTRCSGTECKDPAGECNDNKKWKKTINIDKYKCKKCKCAKLRKPKNKLIALLACAKNIANVLTECCATCKKYGF